MGKGKKRWIEICALLFLLMLQNFLEFAVQM